MELLLRHRELRLHRGIYDVGEEEVERAGDGASYDEGLVGLGPGGSNDVDVMCVGERDTRRERERERERGALRQHQRDRSK